MPRIWKVALAAALTAAASMPASGNSERLSAAGEKHVLQLMRLMDRDRNVRVTKEEFMQFVEAEFDRLDANRSGDLSTKELSQSRIYPQTRANPLR
jgi:EF hand